MHWMTPNLTTKMLSWKINDYQYVPVDIIYRPWKSHSLILTGERAVTANWEMPDTFAKSIPDLAAVYAKSMAKGFPDCKICCSGICIQKPAAWAHIFTWNHRPESQKAPAPIILHLIGLEKLSPPHVNKSWCLIYTWSESSFQASRRGMLFQCTNL